MCTIYSEMSAKAYSVAWKGFGYYDFTAKVHSMYDVVSPTLVAGWCHPSVSSVVEKVKEDKISLSYTTGMQAQSEAMPNIGSESFSSTHTQRNL